MSQIKVLERNDIESQNFAMFEGGYSIRRYEKK